MGPPKTVAPITSVAIIGIIATSSQKRQTGERSSPAVRSWPQKPQKRSNGPATPWQAPQTLSCSPQLVQRSS